MHDVVDLVRPEWPPLRHVRRGWDALTPAERDEVRARVETVLAGHAWGPHKRDALLHFVTFLAQVETIAIEIPLRFLPHAPPELRPTLRRQLVDEVFHSTIFSRLAHELALPAQQPPAPLPSAERLLDRIRNEPDLGVAATLLNLVAEGWIETLFKHALKWDVAKEVFRAVLADEARHVQEAQLYMGALDPVAAQAAVSAFEQGMLEVGAEPSVALAILDLAGPTGQRRLGDELRLQHRKHLAEAGLRPSPTWDAIDEANLRALEQPLPAMPTPVPDTSWRRMARKVWTTPRDPTMQGDFDVPVGHIPRKLLTPVMIAALGRAWAGSEELNRIIARDQMWQLPYANVGVRVLLDDDELATVVIPEADRRSVPDIQRMLKDGIAQLRAARKAADAAAPGGRPAPASAATSPSEGQDPEVAALAPALPHMFAVAISNAGKWGVISGAGAFSGWVSPSTDITVGLRRRLPRWRGVAYLPSWHVNVAAIQDHRVFDGRASAVTVTSIQQALSPQAVKAILATPDTLPRDEDLPHPGGEGPQGAAAASFLGALGGLQLPKYLPVAIGGLGLGALLGVGGYFLYQTMSAAAVANAAGAAGGAAGGTSGTSSVAAAGAGGPGTAGAGGTGQAAPGARSAAHGGAPTAAAAGASVAASRPGPAARAKGTAKPRAKAGRGTAPPKAAREPADGKAPRPGKRAKAPPANGKGRPPRKP